MKLVTGPESQRRSKAETMSAHRSASMKFGFCARWGKLGAAGMGPLHFSNF
jgi:hypothetical protein